MVIDCTTDEEYAEPWTAQAFFELLKDADADKVFIKIKVNRLSIYSGRFILTSMQGLASPPNNEGRVSGIL